MKKWLSQLTVAGRLSAGFGFLLLLLLALGTVSALELNRMSARMDHIVDVNNRRTDLARDLLENINAMAIQARTITLLTDMGGIDAEMKGINLTAKDYTAAETALSSSLANENPAGQERALLDEIVALGKKAMPQILAAAQQGADGDNVGATMTLTTQARPTETQWRKKVAEFVALQASHTASAVAEAKAARNRALGLSLGVVILALASGSLVAWRIIVGIKSPIEQALSVAERIAEGDLTSDVHVSQKDELGRLLQAVSRMQDRLRFLVGEIRETSQSIFVASSEVASGNTDLSFRTEKAASNLEHTASSMEALTGTVRQSAESAAQANKLASSARSVATRGGEVVSQVVSTMNEINNSSRKIADIIGVIDGIAFQTNVLALNAAVEAARAGEQGRGFAVVAGEVRSLAGRSAEAAREIKHLIGGSVERVEAGARLVSTAGTTMNEIVASVERVSDIISEITAAATEQSSGIGEINTAVSQLDQMTQQNAALVEESASAAESLKEQASRLSEMVGTFKLQRT